MLRFSIAVACVVAFACTTNAETQARPNFSRTSTTAEHGGYVPARYLGEAMAAESRKGGKDDGSGVPAISIEQFGGGCAVADNTSALLRAVASNPNPVTVIFPNNCDYKFTQQNAIVFTKPVWLRGQGLMTQLKYVPTGDGVFLSWSAPIGVLPMYGSGISSLTMWSSDKTYTKIMMETWDVSHFMMFNVDCGFNLDTQGATGLVITGGSGSICFYPHGRDIGRIDTVWFAADKPITIGMNPHWYGSQDHWHWSNLYLQNATRTVGVFPNISVDPGVVFSDTTFDGYQAWVGGSHGFYYNDTAAVNDVQVIVSGGTGYAVGDHITIAGGRCSTRPVVQVLRTGAGGSITGASISDPGVCAERPRGPSSQFSTTGRGTGAKFIVVYHSSYRLSFSNVRTENGNSAAGPRSYSFYIAPQRPYMIGLTIQNSVLDGHRNGIFLKDTRAVKISQNVDFDGVGGRIAISATSANNNDMVSLSDNWWDHRKITADFSGMCALNAAPSPKGASSVIPSTAFYSSSNCSTRRPKQ